MSTLTGKSRYLAMTVDSMRLNFLLASLRSLLGNFVVYNDCICILSLILRCYLELHGIIF